MSQALLVIDLQNDYFPGGDMELMGVEAAARTAAELLAIHRDAGLPLLHVRHIFKDPRAPFFRPGEAGSEIHDSLAPLAAEQVLVKHQVNSFHETDLKQHLDTLGIDSLLICGAMSNMCVEGTTRAASELGYRCQVIHDACATCDQQFEGRVVPAQDAHDTAMATLGFAYADVLSLADWKASR